MGSFMSVTYMRVYLCRMYRSSRPIFKNCIYVKFKYLLSAIYSLYIIGTVLCFIL